ncbi:hypothetical protein TYRP_007339 [Tyrophagus putrescentiae]|nr:hypothetical protein TYRP_007339 [Tyrophagus putrescentiae]
MSSSMKLSTLSGGKKTKPATTSKRKDASKPISEEEVLKKETITPADVCNLETYTKGKRLTLMAMAGTCVRQKTIYTTLSLRALKYVIWRTAMCSLRLSNHRRRLGKQPKADAQSSSETTRRSPEASIATISDDGRSSSCGRHVRYKFTSSFLRLKTVGATVEFKVGGKAIKNFRMIERHFFRDTLLKTFDFDFGFCIPDSTNTCEHIYDFPLLTPELCTEMINNPYCTKSDSFYFVDNKLIMHNKADYSYNADQVQ